MVIRGKICVDLNLKVAGAGADPVGVPWVPWHPLKNVEIYLATNI